MSSALKTSFNRSLPVRLLGTLLLAGSALGNTFSAQAAAVPAAAPATSAKPFYWRRMFIRHIPEVCANEGVAVNQTPPGARDLRQNLDVLRRGALLGPALSDFSAKADIWHCPVPYDNNISGTWADKDGLVRVAIVPGLPWSGKLSTQAHELTHGIQRETGAAAVNRHWTIRDFQMNAMAYEAAAHTTQYLLALELGDAGLKEPLQWEYASATPEPAKTAAAAYAQAQQAGASHEAALAAAGSAAWQAQFGVRTWTDAYNNLVLTKFIDLIVHGHIGAPSEAHPYTLEQARRTGWISKDLNFTADLDHLPSYDARFGGNTRMRQAFDYVALEHIAYTRGRDSKPYIEELARLEEQKNPYLGVDIAVAGREMNMKTVTLSPLEVMNCLAGVTACHYGGEVLKPERFRIDLRPPPAPGS
jgi:hypothetical protein